MNDDQILDEPIDDEDYRKKVVRNLASNGKRFANLIIDSIVYYFIFVALIYIDESLFEVPLLIYIVWLMYYWGMETLTGRTVGKLITRTKVVKEDGSHPSGINLLGRTLCRAIPFEAFSFLGVPGKGWHDSIPKVYVINE